MEWAAKALARATGADIDIEEFKAVAIFCGAGLLLSVAAALVLDPDVWAALLCPVVSCAPDDLTPSRSRY